MNANDIVRNVFDTAAGMAKVAAEVNAQTIADQRRLYKAEISGLHAKIRDLEAANAKLEAQTKDFWLKATDARRALVNLKEDLDSAVVEIGGRNITLWSAYTAHEFRDICACGDLDCESGCSGPTDAELCAEYAAEGGE